LALCGFFLDVGLSIHDQCPSAGSHNYWRYDINETRNPYGVLAVGYEANLSMRVSLSLALRHESSIPVNDKGTDSVQLTLRWHPFAL
jgi:hypothetical protein